MTARKATRRSRAARGTVGRPPDAATPHVSPGTARLVAGVAALAAVVERWWFARAWDETRTLSSVFYRGDTDAFVSFAAHLVAGEPFDNGVPFHPPGWPFALSMLFRLAGFDPLHGVPPDPALVKAFVAVISAASVGLGALLAWRLAGVGAMLAVAVMGVFHFGHVAQGTVPNSEPLYGLLVVAVLLVAERAAGSAGEDRGKPSAGRLALTVGLGLLAGAAAVVRAEFLLGLGLLAVYLWVQSAQGRRSWTLAAYGVGAVLALTPTTVAHWRSLSEFNAANAARLPGPIPRFAPVTSYGAFNFATANHADADGGPNRDLALLDPTTPEEAELLAQGQLDLAVPGVYRAYVDGYWLGWRWILRNPGAAASLFASKAGLTAGVLAHGYLLDNVPVGVDGERRRVDLLDPASRWLWLPHAVLLLIGARQLLADRRARWLLLTPLLTLAASALLFFGYVRLGAAYLPVLWILQGCGLARLLRLVPWPAPLVRQAPAWVVGLIVVLLAVEGARVTVPRSVQIDGPRMPDGRLLLDETVQVRRVR